jgi:SAM-dependent methyltransferase
LLVLKSNVMIEKTDYLELNKKAWNNKVPYHIASNFYENEAFIQGKNSLRHVELVLLNRLNLKDKSLLHLQCHFGQDSISLARLGAKVTGLDFSLVAIEKARELAILCKEDLAFVEEDVLQYNGAGSARFEVVFTSYGTIGWFSDLSAWAKVVARSLVSGGSFVMVDFHPFIWSFDDDLKSFAYDYFQAEPIIEVTNGTYADRTAPLNDTIATWNHGMSEIISALLAAGLNLKEFKEYDYSTYDCFANLQQDAPEVFRFEHVPVKIPMMYSLVLNKP